MIRYCNDWFLRNAKLQFFLCLAKGFFSTILTYVSLGGLAFLVNEIQTSLQVANSTFLLIKDDDFRIGLGIYFIASCLAAYFQYSFFKDSYRLWALHSTSLSDTFVKQVRRLPSAQMGKLNRFYIDQVESMLNSGNRPRATGAFGHYSRIMYLEVIKVVVFGAGLFYIAPKFGALITACFLFALPWIVGSNRRSSDYSVAAESQQRLSAIERRISLRNSSDSEENGVENPETEKFFSLITENYLQSKANSYFSTLANVIALAFVIIFIVLSVASENSQAAYWVAVILLGKLFATSVMQLSSSWILMSRQAPLAFVLNSTLKDFESHASDAASKEIQISKSSEIDFSSQLLWIYQSKVFPSSNDLNALLYLSNDIDFNLEMETIVITQNCADSYSDDWLEQADLPIDLDNLSESAERYDLNHLKRVISKAKNIPKVALKAAKIQYELATSIHQGKRIYLPTNLFWMFDVSLFSTLSSDTRSQLILYFSHHTLDSRWPKSDVPVLKYDHLKKNSSLSVGLYRNEMENLQSYDFNVNDFE